MWSCGTWVWVGGVGGDVRVVGSIGKKGIYFIKPIGELS